MEALAPLFFLVGLYFLIGPGLGIAAFLRSGRQRAELAALRRRLAEIEGGAGPPPVAAAPSPPAEAPVVAAPEAEIAPAPEAEPAAAAPEPVPAAMAAPAVETAAPPRGPGGLEERLAARWILWVGAVALALGGVFLVKYAVDEGWLGPATRVTLGFLFGCALTIAGEWLRQRPLQRAIAAVRPNHVPPALTASGLFIAYASVYAAFGLYDLLSPLAAFALLAALSVTAMFLSLLQGPFTALLGIIGGFATPLLIPSEQPQAWGLFTYLLFLAAAALVVVRFTGALWVRVATLTGALLWPAFWLATLWQQGDAAAIGTYLVLLAALSLFVPAEPDPAERLDNATLATWFAAAADAVLIFALLRMDAYGTASLLALGAFVVLSFVAGRRLAAFEPLPLLAEVLCLAAIAAWHLPQILTTTSPFYSYPAGYVAGPFVPPELHLFLSTAIALAALLGIVPFVLMWRARRPPLWAAVSASAPVLLLLLGYWRIEGFGIDLRWSAAALALAAIDIVAASRLERRRAEAGMVLSLAFFAAAAVAALSLCATMALQEAWLTVALSLQLPALAWIGRRLELDALRPIALAVAAIVLVRLAFNHDVLDYPLGRVPGLNWMLYGYGLPAVAFFTAANWFRQRGDDYLVTVLELGAVAFAALLVTLEVHNLVTGPLSAPRQGLLEPSLQSIAWLAIAIGLALSGRWSGRRAMVWARHVLAALAAGQVLVWQLGLDNPLWNDDPVGNTPIFNLLLLAYGIPAALIAVYGWAALPPGRLLRAAGVLTLLLAFVDLSLEVRRSFQGPLLSLDRATADAEWYCYSAAWLGFAGVLLMSGIWRRDRALRYASLAVLLLVIGKVFLSDMAGLTGLYRVASFAGLGLCLIAVGYLYQRFVFPMPPLRDRDIAA
jgi:uncharacterized membrane protein